MSKHIYTLAQSDVGMAAIDIVSSCPTCGVQQLGKKKTVFLRSSFGYIQQRDVGKRVYDLGGEVYQIENDEQLAERKRKEQEK